VHCEKLYPSDWQALAEMAETSLQLLPFYATRSQSCGQLKKALYHQNKYSRVFGYAAHKRLMAAVHVVMKDGLLQVKNALVLDRPDNPLTRLSVFERELCLLAKNYRLSQLSFCIRDIDNRVNHFFAQRQYQQEQLANYRCFATQLSYRTGLVLGGGGARGAYQIGVWRALEELGISFEMVSGTSVGALNGGLILQGELDAAVKMWQDIDTQQILSFPSEKKAGVEALSPEGLVSAIQQLTVSAIRNVGVSTAPLQQLIADMMDQQKISRSGKDFFIITTHIPDMKETVISLADTKESDLPLWLLASASFFPAMAAAKVDGEYYVDGGYRNNIPTDVLLAHGATEIIEVNVKGPGLTKPLRLPPDISYIQLESPWSLGTVLLFDGKRSDWNMKLGYFETMKRFERYAGKFYTFPLARFMQESQELTQSFVKFLDARYPLKESRLFHEDTLRAFRKLYGSRVVPETVVTVILELSAQLFDIDPTRVYTLQALLEELTRELSSHQEEHSAEGEMLYSLPEWTQQFIKQQLPISDKQLILDYCRFLQAEDESSVKGNVLSLLMEMSIANSYRALFLLFLLNQEDET